MIDLDDTDRAILRALIADGGLNAKQVGAAVGLSQPAAWRRVRRLEEAGVIRGRRVVLDRFVPIGEVAAMKFGPEGGQRSPIGVPQPDGDDLVLGDARLEDVDWEARTARLAGPSDAARAFARDELGLTVG